MAVIKGVGRMLKYFDTSEGSPEGSSDYPQMHLFSKLGLLLREKTSYQIHLHFSLSAVP